VRLHVHEARTGGQCRDPHGSKFDFSNLLDTPQRQWLRYTIACVHEQAIALVIARFGVQYKVNPPPVRFA
jgi:hypothetical protein